MSLEEARSRDPACWGLIVNMQAAEWLSLEQIRAFFAGQ
jgi:hypothetical protein